ncbi:MAG TPA: hypothetical protein VEQ66_11550 [Propionibacteriaceae bacterium]|nr:hypothetical protein [Propionibacteriaceae bacterium]
MEVNTQAIIRLAWARTLGLADDALMQPAAERLVRVDESIIMFVSLWQHRVLIGPQWLVDQAPALSNAALASGSRLLGLAAGHGGRLLEETVLGFTDDYVSLPGLDDAQVSKDARSVGELERSCPPDDVAEVGLSQMSEHFVTLDAEGRPKAVAGYGESQGILASIGVLVPPSQRLAGHGTLAAAVATNDALDAGLVAQWRARRGHRGGLGVARRLGYREIGAQTTLLLHA